MDGDVVRPNSKTILITPRPLAKDPDDYHACIQGHPELWDCGKTPAEAIGKLICNHREAFGIGIYVTGPVGPSNQEEERPDPSPGQEEGAP